jgi:hypothetical protein
MELNPLLAASTVPGTNTIVFDDLSLVTEGDAASESSRPARDRLHISGDSYTSTGTTLAFHASAAQAEDSRSCLLPSATGKAVNDGPHKGLRIVGLG